ncbi:MAG: dihydroneopterin aldolase [Candidatus Methylomirabilales bacterium]
MTDKILIKGLRVFGHHGVHQSERERGQDFLVEVEAEVDLEGAGRTDDLADTVDYGSLIMDVQRVVSSERYRLLEALARRIAETVLERPSVSSVTVRVLKRGPPTEAELEAVGVEIERRR